LGITGGWTNILSVYTANKQLNWIGAEVLGIIIGAMISAIATKEFKLRMPKDPKTYLQVMVGGALMGFGAATAGGCNIGHFLTGCSHARDLVHREFDLLHSRELDDGLAFVR
jgi:YeeE/YedE family (DUF395).